MARSARLWLPGSGGEYGGGVGIGYSLHTGMVVVADGTADAARRVLTTDPGMGIIRHVDAGYEKAIEEAQIRSIHVPMRD